MRLIHISIWLTIISDLAFLLVAILLIMQESALMAAAIILLVVLKRFTWMLTVIGADEEANNQD